VQAVIGFAVRIMWYHADGEISAVPETEVSSAVADGEISAVVDGKSVNWQTERSM
jgi:hypothetical protein